MAITTTLKTTYHGQLLRPRYQSDLNSLGRDLDSLKEKHFHAYGYRVLEKGVRDFDCAHWGQQSKDRISQSRYINTENFNIRRHDLMT